MGTAGKPKKGESEATKVSIQLMSPASGDPEDVLYQTAVLSFHSINVPSEWGH